MANVTLYPAQVQDPNGKVIWGGNLNFTGTSVPVTSSNGVWVPPTADPHVSGAVWNNAGTLTISSG